MSSTVIFKNNKTGIYFLKIQEEDNVTVKIMDKDDKQLGGADYGLFEYHFKNAPEFLHPFMSWENLDCCNGWKYDSEYLLNSVQAGKKLVAQENFKDTVLEGVKDEEVPQILKLDPEKVNWQITLNSTLEKDESCKDARGIIIARKGALKDYFEYDKVIKAYKLQGIEFSEEMKASIAGFMEMELIHLMLFGFSHGIDLMPLPVVGMALGYPLESTAALLNIQS